LQLLAYSIILVIAYEMIIINDKLLSTNTTDTTNTLFFQNMMINNIF